MTSWALALALAMTACAGGSGSGPLTDPSDPAPLEGTVRVFAAASLSDALAEIEVAVEARHPALDVQLNLAGSSTLREQILQGAPADVFASANPDNMDQLVRAGEIDGDPVVLATNRLQLVVPAENPGGVSGLADLARPELLVGLCAEAVPCGDFARQVLARDGVEASLDTNEPDVRALLTKVAEGELDVGIVYRTDVMAAGDEVLGLDIADEVNVVAEYPLARLSESPNPLGAAAVIELMLGDEGRRILAAHGFETP